MKTTSKTEWWTELASTPHHEQFAGITFKVIRKLYEEKTPYQHIEIYDTPYYGGVLVFDGCVMLTDRDNYLYHEMMVHPALFTHCSPKLVAIIGGGDCGSLKETLKHPTVAYVTQIEIDERVTRVSEQFFPALCTSNADPRAHFEWRDGIAWMACAEKGSLDVILVDSTDPIGPATGLFQKPFYENCLKALRPGGIIAEQSESPFYHPHLIQEIRSNMLQAGFSSVQTLFFPQPTYPSGQWSITLAGKDHSLEKFRIEDVIHKPFNTRYYNAKIHEAAKAIPEFLAQTLAKAVSRNTSDLTYPPR